MQTFAAVKLKTQCEEKADVLWLNRLKVCQCGTVPIIMRSIFLHPLFNLNTEDKNIVYCLYQNFKAH